MFISLFFHTFATYYTTNYAETSTHTLLVYRCADFDLDSKYLGCPIRSRLYAVGQNANCQKPNLGKEQFRVAQKGLVAGL